VEEHFVRSQGAGGQKVNKTSSAVFLRHLPTGLTVKMQKERSQALNRFLAWRLLAEKLEAIQTGTVRGQEKAEKIRKQKKRRRRRSRTGEGN
jgi:protein subunit release factor B